MTDPSNGTLIVALRLMCDLLHCHVSAASSPRAATTSRAAKHGCSRRDSIFLDGDPCIGSSALGVPSAAALATVSSSNHVGRRVLTPVAFCDHAVLMSDSARADIRVITLPIYAA